MSVLSHHWFGAAPLEHYIATWGARAIFNGLNEERPLDLLWDRQNTDVSPGTSEKVKHLLHEAINAGVLAAMQKMATHFSADSHACFVQHFDWPHDPSLVLVANGSPNASHGYFYIGVSLVPRDKAPAEVRPDIEAERKRKEADLKWLEWELEQKRLKKLELARRREVRERAQIKAMEFSARATGEYRNPGDALRVGDTLTVNANQADRDAIVTQRAGQLALIEYQMPNGKTYCWEVDAITHKKVGNINKSKLPKRWANAG
jgi:hypothetical protein